MMVITYEDLVYGDGANKIVHMRDFFLNRSVYWNYIGSFSLKLHFSFDGANQSNTILKITADSIKTFIFLILNNSSGTHLRRALWECSIAVACFFHNVQLYKSLLI